jgi:hypothetical protein
MAATYATPFGIGFLSVVPSGTNPTPIRIAVLKEISVKTSTDFEELYGEEIDPIDAADKSRSTEISAKASGFNALLYAAAFGASATTGSVIGVKDETATIPTTPFEVTVTHGATFALDCGVIDTTAGIVMTRGATATAAGVYAVDTATGKYSFNTADAGHVVSASYLWTDAANGKTVAIGGSLAGAATQMRLDIARTYASSNTLFSFPAVKFAGVSESFGNQKHGEIDLTFRAFKDPTTGKLMNVYMTK